MALESKPALGDKVKHVEKGVCVVKGVSDDGTLSLETEDGKHAFNAHASEASYLDKKKAKQRKVEQEREEIENQPESP